MVVGRQPNAPAAFTSGEIPGTHFQRLSRPQCTRFFFGRNHGKKSLVTQPGIDPGAVRLVAQRLNHYATPRPHILCGAFKNLTSIRLKLQIVGLAKCTEEEFNLPQKRKKNCVSRFDAIVILVKLFYCQLFVVH